MSTSARASTPRRGQAAPPADERHERDQPDQELRREHLAEDDERADCGGAGAEEPVAIGRAAGVPDPDRDHRGDLEQCREARERPLAVPPSRFCEPWLDSIVRSRPKSWCAASRIPEPRLSIWSGRAGLHPERVPDPARRQHREGKDDRRDHGEERARRRRAPRAGRASARRGRRGAAPAGPGRPSPPSRGRACPRPRRAAAGEEDGQRRDRQQRRPEVEAAEDDRAEQQRRDGDEERRPPGGSSRAATSRTTPTPAAAISPSNVAS